MSLFPGDILHRFGAQGENDGRAGTPPAELSGHSPDHLSHCRDEAGTLTNAFDIRPYGSRGRRPVPIHRLRKGEAAA